MEDTEIESVQDRTGTGSAVLEDPGPAMTGRRLAPPAGRDRSLHSLQTPIMLVEIFL